MTCAYVASFKQIQNKHTESYQEQILEYLRSTKGIFLVYGVKDKQVVKDFTNASSFQTGKMILDFDLDAYFVSMEKYSELEEFKAEHYCMLNVRICVLSYSRIVLEEVRIKMSYD